MSGVAEGVREQAGATFNPMAFGESLRLRRKALRLTQEDVARVVEVDRVTIQNLEAGLADRAKRTPANPQLDTLIGLCKALRGRLVIDLAFADGVRIEFDD